MNRQVLCSDFYDHSDCNTEYGLQEETREKEGPQNDDYNGSDSELGLSGRHEEDYPVGKIIGD